MLYIHDDDLKLAFTTMINKLVYCHKLVLKPYLKALQENTGDASLLNIQQLEMLLEQNTEQRETLHKLMEQGYIDQILFTQENNALLSQANDYRNEIEALNRSQTLDATKVYETERLLHFCERGEMQLEYSEELFELFVDHIEVYSRQKIGFALHCGLVLMGHTPFGYRIENGKAVIDEAAAAQVRDLYKNYLSGLSITNAAKEAGLNLLHSGSKRMMLNRHYLGDDFYPAIIDPASFDAVSAELSKRSTQLGRNDRYIAPIIKRASTAFRLGDITENYENPVRQAEYLYSLIESEVK